MDLGQSLRRCRKEKGLTQKELATKAGLSNTTIVYIETGRIWPKKETIDLLAQAMEFPSAYVILFSVEAEDVPEKNRASFMALMEGMKSLLFT